jgi:branched-chain amino acid transport system permease protein
MKTAKDTTSKFILILVIAVCVVLLPHFVSTYYAGLVIQMFIMAIFAISLDVLVGHTGLPSMGHAAYFGAAGYATAFLFLAGIKSFWLAALAGLVTGGLTACLFGLLAVRAYGPYFMIITVALSQVLWGIAFKWRSITGGDDGIPGIKRPSLGMGFTVTSDLSFYYFAFIIFIIVFIALLVLARSPFGHALRGIRESESRMKALGYNVWLYKYVAFVIAGAFAGVSGVMWVYYTGYVNPSDTAMGTSVRGLIMLIIGGSGTAFGPVIGASVMVLLQNVVSSITQRWSLVLGIIYVLAVMLFSDGIFSAFKRDKKD